MKVLNYTHAIGVPVDAAWSVFANFGGFAEWAELGVPVEVEGPGGGSFVGSGGVGPVVGMVRTLVVPGLGRVGERLDALDNRARSLRYSLVEGEPLGMIEYAADVSFVSGSFGGTEVVWVGTFEGNNGTDPDEIARNLQDSYKGMSESLQRFVTANAQRK